MLTMPYGLFSLQLIALAVSTALFLWTYNQDFKCCARFGRFIGFVTMVLALLSVICTLIAGYRSWAQSASVDYTVVEMQDQVKEKAVEKKK